MTQKNLKNLFNPKSIAVVGVSSRENSAGNIVVKNLLRDGFNGPIMPVSKNNQSINGVLAYPSIDKLPIVPDLAIVTIKSINVPSIIAELNKFGCKVAVIMASGFRQPNANTSSLLKELQSAHGDMRILGPNSLGLLIPSLKMNASLAHISAKVGKIAFISQSAAICTTVLDWANNKGIGFSHFISIGDAIDIEFDELLDYLGRDPKTSFILLYIDSINERRHFLSAARAASRNKPILVIKSGRSNEGSIAAKLHTGGISGNDAVYDAAFKRAGMLRVKDLHELFAATESLAHFYPLKGDRLALITNGGGPAVLAVDELIRRGGKIATLSKETIAKLNKVLPNHWSGQNPVDIVGDANGERYSQTLKIIMDSSEVDVILIMYSPTALNTGEVIAKQIIDTINSHPNKNKFSYLTNWSGEDAAYSGRKLFNAANISSYRTPEGAIGAFMHLIEYKRNQKLLQEIPISLDSVYKDTSKVKDILKEYMENNQLTLETIDSQEIFNLYGLKTIKTLFAKNAMSAVECANIIGYPVALKVQSPNILHKADVHGVMLNLNNADEVLNAANLICENVEKYYPSAKIEGVLVQKMALTASAQELRVAVINDPVFGPAIFLGAGGSNWDPSLDAVVALPPLNMTLARYMIIQALKTGKIHEPYKNIGMDMHALCVMLTKISQIIIDCPEIESIDLNPILVAGDSITLLDTNIILNPNMDVNRLAIRPYPKELEEVCTLNDGRTILLRPILPEDEPKHMEFDNSLSKEDRYKRYFGMRSQMTHEEMAVLTQIDYSREMAFVAIEIQDNKEGDTLGAVRASIDPDNIEAEFAMAVRSNQQGLGIGSALLSKLITYYKNNNTKLLTGCTMLENQNMASLAKRLGFSVISDFEEQLIHMRLVL